MTAVPLGNRMQLVRLIYASEATRDITLSTVKSIAESARSANEGNFITGVLTFSHRYFLQAIEGPRDAVNALYVRLGKDERHAHLTLLSYDEIDERCFGDWSMGFLGRLGDSESLVLRFSASDQFAPLTFNGSKALGLLREAAVSMRRL